MMNRKTDISSFKLYFFCVAFARPHIFIECIQWWPNYDVTNVGCFETLSFYRMNKTKWCEVKEKSIFCRHKMAIRLNDFRIYDQQFVQHFSWRFLFSFVHSHSLASLKFSDCRRWRCASLSFEKKFENGLWQKKKRKNKDRLPMDFFYIRFVIISRAFGELSTSPVCPFFHSFACSSLLRLASFNWTWTIESFPHQTGFFFLLFSSSHHSHGVFRPFVFEFDGESMMKRRL